MSIEDVVLEAVRRLVADGRLERLLRVGTRPRTQPARVRVTDQLEGNGGGRQGLPGALEDIHGRLS